MIYRDETGMKLMRPPGTHYVSGLIDWINAIPEEHRGTIVEVGSWCGESAVIFAKYFKMVVCVDSWQGYDEQFRVFKERIRPLNNVIWHRLPSVRAAKIYLDKSIDGAYIDAGHTYQDVLTDTHAWRRKCTAFIGGHDYQDNNGVRKAVDVTFRDVKIFKDTSWLHLIG